MTPTKDQLLAEIRERAKTNPLLLHKYLPQQALFANDDAKVKVIFGGNRSGKTEGAARYVNEKGIKMENGRIWCAALTFSDSVNIQQTKIHNLLPTHEVKYGRFDEINGYTNRKLKYARGTLGVFKSYDQGREAFQGDAEDIIWLDEEPPLDIWHECKMRLIDRNGELLLTMTSLKGVTELIEEVFDGYTTVKSKYAPLVDEELPVIAEKNGIKIYFLWTEDNPHINYNRMMEEAKLMTKQEIKSRFYGIPVNLQGKIYPSFNKDIHVIKREDFSLDDCQVWNVLDPHDRKPWAIQWWAVHKTGSACCFAEYPEQNFNEMLYDDKTYDDYAKHIKAKEAVFLKDMRNKYVKRIIDPNFGNKTMQLAERQGGQSKTTPREELRKRKLYYDDGIDSLEAGHLKVREMLHYEEKDGEIIVQPKIFFCDNCHNTITHMARYSRGDIETSDGDIKDKVKPREKYKDFCFIGTTIIRTTRGLVYIKDVKVGDMVYTDIGISKVLASNITGYNRPTIKATFSDGRTLTATPSHKIYLNSGYAIPLDNMRYGDIVKTWEDRELIIGKSGKADIINWDQDSSTVRFGKRISELLLVDFRYIIKTAINSITIYPTLNLLQLNNTEHYIHAQKKNSKSYRIACEKGQRDIIKCLNGIKAKREGFGLLSILKKYLIKSLKKFLYVNIVERNTRQNINSIPCSAITNVNQTGEEKKERITKQESVQSAIRHIPQTSIPNQNVVPRDVLALVKVEQKSPETVYNLTVEGRHRYYANDVLVSNCDDVRYFCMANPYYILRTKYKQDERKVY